MAPYTEVLRDTVDRLLNMYCSDPLEVGLGAGVIVDRLTPGGRKAFGAAAAVTDGGGHGEDGFPVKGGSDLWEDEEVASGLQTRKKVR